MTHVSLRLDLGDHECRILGDQTAIWPLLWFESYAEFSLVDSAAAPAALAAADRLQSVAVYLYLHFIAA